MIYTRYIAVAALVLSQVTTTAISEPKVDEALKTYTAASGVSGNLSSVGSDTLANLMTLWAEEYKGFYPNINIQIQAAGSSTAPPAYQSPYPPGEPDLVAPSPESLSAPRQSALAHAPG